MRIRLKMARVRRGWTQEETASRLGMVTMTYNYIENGKRDGTDEQWKRIQELYGLSDRYVKTMRKENK